MSYSNYLLLTGATGLLGRYLLRDLLATKQPVAVLVRDSASAPACERVAQMVAWGCESLQTALAQPVVLSGDIALPHLGLVPADRVWLARHCRAVIHAAAQVSFANKSDGEPWRTNVGGTQHVLDLCRRLGLNELHHVSTAFICGARVGTVYEHELEAGQQFHNPYERSKYEAERMVRKCDDLRTTIYRPSVIVGDARTGYTCSYHGFYRLVELGLRLARGCRPGESEPNRSLPLRLPLTGAEPRDLVPVDWVSAAMVRLINCPTFHGHTYHLTAREPVTSRVIKEVAEEVLGIRGVEWSNPNRPTSATPLEKLLLDNAREYQPYLQGDPVFDCRNTRMALPTFPAPRVDRALLARLIRFAVADRWGRGSRTRTNAGPHMDCAHFVEKFFPASASRSSLREMPLHVTVGLEVVGPGGGQWSCRWEHGQLVEVRRGANSEVHVRYRLDTATFEAIVRGRQSPQDAFFDRRIEITGDLEQALKLALIFEQFMREFPYRPGSPLEAPDAIHAVA